MRVEVEDHREGKAGLGQVGHSINVVGYFLSGVVGFLFGFTAGWRLRSVNLAPTDCAILIKNMFMGSALSWAFGPGPTQSLSTNFIWMISVGHDYPLQTLTAE